MTCRAFVGLRISAALGATFLSFRAEAWGSGFQGLGDLPGGTFVSGAFGVSRDGKAVVGSGIDATNSMIAFRWTQMDGMVPLGELPGGPAASASVACSATGKYAVGSTDSAAGREAFLWSAAGGIVAIGDLPGGPTHGVATDVSADGAIVGGMGDLVMSFPPTGEAFRWTQAGGIVGLGYLEPGHEYSTVNAMSADGGVLVGVSGGFMQSYEAVRWSQASGMQGLGQLPGSDIGYSVAWGVSSTGAVIVGEAHFSEPQDAEVSDACYWTEATGWVSIGDLPGGAHYAVALGTTPGGEVIVGIADFDSELNTGRAFIWDAAHGIRDLKTALELDYGLDLSGWQLGIAYDISDDGTVIVGDGINPSGDPEGWLARLDKPACDADLDADGAVALSDLAILLSAFGSMCP